MILDTPTRGRILFSKRVYKLNTILGDKLITAQRAELYIEPKNIKFVRADGEVLYLTRSEYNQLVKDAQSTKKEVKENGTTV